MHEGYIKPATSRLIEREITVSISSSSSRSIQQHRQATSVTWIYEMAAPSEPKPSAPKWVHA